MRSLKRPRRRAFTLTEVLMASAVLCVALGMAVFFLSGSGSVRDEFSSEFEKQSTRFLAILKKDLRSASGVETKGNSIRIETARPVNGAIEKASLAYEIGDAVIKRTDAAGSKVLMDFSRMVPAGYCLYFEIAPAGDRNYDYILRAFGPGNRKIFEKRETVSSGI